MEVNGGICIQKRNAWEEFPKVYPGDKVFTVFTIADEDIAMTLPTPRVDINTFCTMVLKQELDFDT